MGSELEREMQFWIMRPHFEESGVAIWPFEHYVQRLLSEQRSQPEIAELQAGQVKLSEAK